VSQIKLYARNMTVSDISEKQKMPWRVYNKYFCGMLYITATKIFFYKLMSLQ